MNRDQENARDGGEAVGVVLVVAEPPVVDVLIRRLECPEFRLEAVSSLGQARSPSVTAHQSRLVLVDRVLAERESLVLPMVAAEVGGGPVVMFSSRPETVADRVRWLSVGAHDFVPWPASASEVAVRIQAVLRHREPEPQLGPVRTLAAGALLVDVLARRVEVAGRSVRLTALEFKLLVFFMCHPGVAFTRTELLRHVWGYDTGPTSTVTVHVRHLREKLEPDPSAPTYIITLWGVGYRFEPAVAETR